MIDKTWIQLDKYTESVLRKKIMLISFFCSIFVIYIHAFNLDSYGIDENTVGFGKAVYFIETYWSNFLRIAVPAFFAVSGMLFFRTFEIGKLLEKWKSRFFSIAIPFFVWCSIYYLYYVVVTNIPALHNLMSGTAEVSFSFGNWIAWLWKDSYYVFWFLKNLIVFILLSPVIWFLLKNHFSKVPTGLIALIAIEVLLWFGIIRLQGLDFYLVGGYLGLNYRDFLLKKNKMLSVVSLVYIFVMFFSGFIIWNFITQIIFLFATWFVLDYIVSDRIKCYWWMSITFFTYVAHDAVLEAAEKCVWMLLPHSSAVALADYIFMPIIVEIFLIAVAYVLRKWLPHLWKLLSGFRNEGKLTT